LSAFAKCVEAGIYGIEIDVHKCRSGELIVLHGGVHGGDLAHTTNGTGLVRDKSWDELKTLSVTSHADGELQGQRIPLLSEVFDLVSNQSVLNIEIKNAPWQYPGFAEDLIAMVGKYKAEETVVLSTIEHGILRTIHQQAPDLKLGLLIDGLLVDIADYADKVGFKCWHPYLGELRADYMTEAHAAGLEVNVWTANTPDEWDLALSLGVDGIVTDDPIALREYLAATSTK
jgi:glycerophosphoryl diester phosphodiesterase